MTMQPHLGRPKDNYKPQLDMNSLALAKVTKVHHREGTVDLQIVKSNTTVSSETGTQGKYSARVLTTAAHYDPVLASSSGKVEPMIEGQMVVLAFLDGLKNQPIVLGSFHQTWETDKNILPEIYPLDPNTSLYDKREAMKSLDVHPSQFYKRIDGIGSMEMSHPSKTFLQIDPDLYSEITDGHKEYDHKDLNEKDPYSGSTRSGRTEESSFPVKVLFQHRSSFDDETTTWTKLFVDKDGMMRLTRDRDDEALSYLELSENGAMKLRRQIDSSKHGEGETFSEVSIQEDGRVSISRTIEDNTSEVFIDSDGDIVFSHGDGSVLRVGKDGIQGGGGTPLGITVAKYEPLDVPDGHMWIDISDLE